MELDSTKRLAILDEGLRRLPSSALLHVNRALTLRVVGRPAEALRAFDTAFAYGANAPTDFEEAGRIAFALGQTARAAALLREAVRRDPKSYTGWLALAPVEATLGRHHEAVGAWDRAARLTGYPQPIDADSILAAQSRRLVDREMRGRR